ncbi:MAG: repressor LexA [Phycisphaerae bacterium]|nr:repressor LexA [Phycisphaerae bacterium]
MPPTQNLTLTPKQIEVLRCIADFRTSRRYSATIAEVADRLGVSRPTVFEHIAALREKGLLADSQGKARSLLPSSRAQRLLSELRDAAWQSETVEGVPLLGRVAAGTPIEAVENAEPLSLRTLFGHGDQLFALQVVGNSMIDEGIRSGDFVLCRRAATADNGALVVAIVDDDSATLKRFYKESERVRLQPANADFNPIFSRHCRIEAVVLGLIRRLS